MSRADGPRRRGGARLPATLWLLASLIALALIVVAAVPLISAVGAAATGSPRSTAPRPPAIATAPGASPPPSISPPGPTETPSGAPLAGDASHARELLDAVPVVSGQSIARYYREQFGQAWFDEDHNGCDTRNDILRRDLTDVVFRAGTHDCKVLSGTLLDPYTGRTVSFAAGAKSSGLVQIDHLVPLAWAWRHGAETWTFEQRQSFANDPLNLRATIGDVNQSKSDSGPSEWMPPASGEQCAYSEGFVAVLSKWQLGVSSADRQKLEDVLAGC